MAQLNEILAINIKKFRGKESQRSFAKRMEINQATLVRIEQGRENITLTTIQKLIDNLHCTVAKLFKS